MHIYKTGKRTLIYGILFVTFQGMALTHIFTQHKKTTDY